MSIIGRTASLLAAAFALSAGTRVARAQQLHYTTSLGYSGGSYIFTGYTWTGSMEHRLDLSAGQWQLGGTIPLLLQNSTAVTYIAGRPIPTGGPDAIAVRERQSGTTVVMGPRGSTGSGRGGTITTQTGLPRGMSRAMAPADAAGRTDSLFVGGTVTPAVHVGDPVLEGSVDLASGDGVLRYFTLQALTKIPVASVASGLGTGQWDYGAGAAASIGVDRAFLFGDATYWVLGDMPDLPLKNNLVYVGGAGMALGESAWTLSGSVSGSTRIIETVTPPVSAGLLLGWSGEHGHAVSIGAAAGLNDAAPDVSLLVSWRVPLASWR